MARQPGRRPGATSGKARRTARESRRLMQLQKAVRSVRRNVVVVQPRVLDVDEFRRLKRAARRVPGGITFVAVRVRGTRAPKRKPGPPKQSSRTRVFTTFKARGVSRNFKRGYSRTDPPLGFVSGPGAFFSQEPFFLGQVKFTGMVPLAMLFRLLNRSLDVRTARGRLADFREAYSSWGYHYQVVEVAGDKTRVLKRERKGR